jgi:hypothetical protein
VAASFGRSVGPVMTFSSASNMGVVTSIEHSSCAKLLYQRPWDIA